MEYRKNGKKTEVGMQKPEITDQRAELEDR
jgi:hypothetical protein